jgi:hypothetical protein
MNYTIAYTYALGYFDGRANGYENTPLDWMNAEEAGIYGRGYDRGVSDYCEFDEGKQA